MAERNQLSGSNVDLVPVFARTPQLFAGALACLGFAPWFNIIGSCAGLVVGIVALLVATAVSLVVADWRAETASRKAWVIIGMATAELSQSEPSQIDPRYLVTSDDRRWQSAFRAHRAAASDARAQLPAVASVMQNFAQTGGPLPAVAELATAPTVANRIRAPWVTENAIPFQGHRSTCVALVQAPPVAAFRPARLGMVCEQSTARAVRLVANGGSWTNDFFGGGRVLPPHAERVEIIVLSGHQGRRDQSSFRSASTLDGAVGSGEPPSCRGPPTAKRRQAHVTRTVPDERPADLAVHDNLGHQVPVNAAELDVIEIYLDQVLRRLLASGSRAPDGDKS